MSHVVSLLMQTYKQKTVSREESPSMLSLRVNKGSLALQDLSGVVDHIVDDLGEEDFVYSSRDATGESWFGTNDIFGVMPFREELWLLPGGYSPLQRGDRILNQSTSTTLIARGVSNLPTVDVRTPGHSQGSPGVNSSPRVQLSQSPAYVWGASASQATNLGLTQTA